MIWVFSLIESIFTSKHPSWYFICKTFWSNPQIIEKSDAKIPPKYFGSGDVLLKKARKTFVLIPRQSKSAPGSYCGEMFV